MIQFPQYADIRLRNAPLIEVICQVRFPHILRIINERPVALQERLRARFPQFQIHHGIKIQDTGELLAPPSAQSTPSIFRFESVDGNDTVSLSSSFYALSTEAYTHWSDFLESLQMVNEAIHAVYDLPYSTRIGLRYINRLTMENTGKTSPSELWDILRSELTVLLNVPYWDEPLEMLNQLLLVGEDDERLTLRTGFKTEPEERCFFLLDLDCYLEGNIPLRRLFPLCERFHTIIYNSFRWCIRDDQLEVFDPFDVTDEEN